MIPAVGWEAAGVVGACDVVALFGPIPRNTGSRVLMSNVELTSLGLWLSRFEPTETAIAGVRIPLHGGPNFSRNFVARSL